MHDLLYATQAEWAPFTIEEFSTWLVEKAEELGNQKIQATVVHFKGLIRILEGDLQKGTQLLYNALDIANRFDIQLILGWSAAFFYFTHLLEGKEDEGEDFAELAWRIFDYWGSLHGIAFFLFIEAMRYFWFGEPEKGNIILTLKVPTDQ